jgi:hypothetical protein
LVTSPLPSRVIRLRRPARGSASRRFQLDTVTLLRSYSRPATGNCALAQGQAGHLSAALGLRGIVRLAVLSVVIALGLGGCATTPGGAAGVRNPLDAQASLAEGGKEGGKATDKNDYPAVHDMPPARKAPLMDVAEQQRIKAALIAARGRQTPAPTKTSLAGAGGSP